MKKWLLLAGLLLSAGALSAYIKEGGGTSAAPRSSIRNAVVFHFDLGAAWLAGDDFTDVDKHAKLTGGFGAALAIPLGRVVTLDFGFLYDFRGTLLNGHASLTNYQVSLEYFTFRSGVTFGQKDFQFSMGLFVSILTAAAEVADNDPGMSLLDVVDSFDIGLDLKVAWRIPLSRKFFITPFMKAQFGFNNIYSDDFLQSNITLRWGADFGINF